MAQPMTVDHRTNRLLAALGPEDFAALEPDLEIVELSRKQVLYETGDLVDAIYFPHDAIISLVNVMEDGAPQRSRCSGVRGPSAF
jgi:hypothetical protein